MDSFSSDRDPVEELAEEFVERYRRGDRPSLKEYTDKYPACAEKIRTLFPALVVMERVRPVPDDAEGADGYGLGSGATKLERLGDYRILREIARGGMGIVYEAEQESLGRHVALKVLLPNALLDARHLRRFEREARAAARLHHTNIVPVFGVGQHEGLHYYVMQFIQGQGLDEVLIELKRLRRTKDGRSSAPADASGDLERNSVSSRQRGSRHDVSAADVAQALLSGRSESGAVARQESGRVGRVGEPHQLAPSTFQPVGLADSAHPTPAQAGLSPGSDSSVHLPGQAEHESLSESSHHYCQSVARIGVQVAEALVYAEAQGILHRDIKPSNLLLDTHGTVWVTDFGLAKATDSEDLTHTGDIVGTLRYMAPERFSGQSDIRSDIYGLGLTLYELLTLRPAFQESDRHKLIERLMHEEPPRPRKHNPDVPRDLETIVLKAIAREPDRRYQTATELADDLKRFVDDRPIRARPLSHAGKLWRWARRNRLVATLVVAVTLLLLGGTGVSSYFAIQAHRMKEAEIQAAVAAVEAKQARDEKGRSDRHLYVAKMLLAQRAWEDTQVGRLLELLGELRPVQPGDTDLRSFEWYYWYRLCYGSSFIFRGHVGAVYCIALSPDGRQLASAGQDSTVKVWDAASGREIHVLQGHSGSIWGVAFSPDGTRLASADSNGLLRIWNLLDQQSLTISGASQGDTFVTFSPDGRWLASASEDRTAKVWDAATGQLTRTLPGADGPVWCVAFSPDSHEIACGNEDGTLKIWDMTANGPPLVLTAHRDPLYGLAYSPDGQRLASASEDGTVRLWEATGGRHLLTLSGHLQGVRRVAFSPDGQRLASASRDGTAKIWNAQSGQLLLTFQGHAHFLDGVAFSPDGQRLVTASRDGTVRIWDAHTPPGPITFRGHTSHVDGVAFSPDSRWVASAGRDGVRVWDAESGREQFTITGHTNHVHCVAFSPDGRRLASGSTDQTVRIWDTSSGQLMLTMRGHDGCVHGVAFSPEGAWVASASDGDGTIRIWDSSSGAELLALKGHTDHAYSVAFSPDGSRLASASQDRTVRVWDASTGRELLKIEGHDGGVYSVAFSPDGKRLASASHDLTIRIWDVATGRETLTLRGHPHVVHGVAFSPDGKRVASASIDGTVKLWDTAAGQETITLKGHKNMVISVAFSPDGTRLASASSDGTVRVWDGRPLDE